MAGALTLAACFWLWYAPGSSYAQAGQRNAWPFASIDDAEIADYIDERATFLAINRVAGQAIITFEGKNGQISRVKMALSAIDPVDRDVLPFIPVRATRADALRDMAQYRGYRKFGAVPVLFYRDAGILWPTAINPQTAPRIMKVYKRAMDAARAEERATRDAFLGVALWYTGARIPGQVRTTKPTAKLATNAKPATNAQPAPSPASATSAKPATSTTPAASARPPVAAPPTPSGVWSLPPVKRGLAIEKALGANLGKTFPVVDRFEKGIVTSIKSLDLGAKSYKSTRQLTSTVKRYIDKVAKFKGDKRGGTAVRKSQIMGRALDLAVPHLGTPAQRAALEKLVAYAKSKDVTVNIIVFP